jgi:hypothetical protein
MKQYNFEYKYGDMARWVSHYHECASDLFASLDDARADVDLLYQQGLSNLNGTARIVVRNAFSFYFRVPFTTWHIALEGCTNWKEVELR